MWIQVFPRVCQYNSFFFLFTYALLTMRLGRLMLMLLGLLMKSLSIKIVGILMRTEQH